MREARASGLGESSRPTLVLPAHGLSFGVATPVVRVVDLYRGPEAFRSNAVVLVTCDSISIWVESMRIRTDTPHLASNS